MSGEEEEGEEEEARDSFPPSSSSLAPRSTDGWSLARKHLIIQYGIRSNSVVYYVTTPGSS